MTKVTRLVMGTREDYVPFPLTKPAHIWKCLRCGAKTYTETEYPQDWGIVCNICAPQIVEEAKQSPSTEAAWTPSDDLNATIEKISDQQGRPSEEVFKRFLEWKTGKSVAAPIYSKSPKDEKE